MSGVIEIISSVGFPIAAFLLMYRLTDKTIRENTHVLKELKEKINEIKK